MSLSNSSGLRIPGCRGREKVTGGAEGSGGWKAFGSLVRSPAKFPLAASPHWPGACACLPHRRRLASVTLWPPKSRMVNGGRLLHGAPGVGGPGGGRARSPGSVWHPVLNNSP